MVFECIAIRTDNSENNISKSEWIKDYYLLFLSLVLLIASTVMGKYSFVFDINSVIPMRNYIFVGIPYFALGVFLKHRLVFNKWWWVILYTTTAFVEKVILEVLGIHNGGNYISTTLLAISVFCVALNSICKDRDILAYIGKKFSAGIYIIHPIIISVVTFTVKKLGCYKCYEYIAPIAIYVVSIVAMSVFNYIVRIIKRVFNNDD